MHPLPHGLIVLFKDLPTARLREIISRPDEQAFGQKGSSNSPDRALFTSSLYYQLPNQINEVRDNLFDYLVQLAEEKDSLRTPPAEGMDAFRLLYRMGEMCLLDHPEPEVRHERMLTWKHTSLHLGEELMVTAFLAGQDQIKKRERDFFAWRPVLASDNVRLKRMMERGIVENHYHLYGSGPHFLLSWLNLMNFPRGRWPDFEKAGMVKQRLSAEHAFHPQYPPERLYPLIKLASLLRARLFAFVQDMPVSDLESDLLDFVQHPELLDIAFIESSRIIDHLRVAWGYKIGGREAIDYALTEDLAATNLQDPNSSNNLPYAGERYWMYRFLQKLYSGDKDAQKIQAQFHLYILIKERFRSEMVQSNGRSGFDNFKIYQDRKKEFIPDLGLWNDLFCRLCLWHNLQYHSLKSLEARIKPRSSVQQSQQEIDFLDRNARDFHWTRAAAHQKWLDTLEEPPPVPVDRHFYVFHFIKDKKSFKGGSRNSKGRAAIEQQAKAFYALRERGFRAAARVYGIDAAGTEMNCRPEAYAQAFRYLQAHVPTGRFFSPGLENTSPFLKITYHAGEDFIDLADGMRMMDEAITFLNMRQGDRIGHGLAMGQDPEQYYQFRSHRLTLPRQELLDNLAWVLYKMEQYAFPEGHLLRPQLHRRFISEFNYIYADPLRQSLNRDFSRHYTQYLNSWRLRGDNPDCYRSGKFEEPLLDSFWQYHALDPDPQLQFYREDPLISKLYHLYHWEGPVKKRGNEQTQFKIDKLYQKAIRHIQQGMMRELSQQGIAIECNPSSNYLIGAFQRYDHHPMLRFYNRGLQTDPHKQSECSQMFISINTDDIGVFSTSLESEFALMALALEKKTDDLGQRLYNPEQIYEYLERIRLMGWEMSFRSIPT